MERRQMTPDFLTLSRFVDHDLEADEEQAFTQSLAAHPDGQRQLERVERVTTQVREALARAAPQEGPARTVTPECLSPEEVIGYVARALSADEKAKISAHLRSCNTCLREVVEARRVSSLLQRSPHLPAPPALTARIKALWKPSISHIVIKLTRRGIELLKHHLEPPFEVLQEIAVPQPAVRSGEEEGSAKVICYELELEEGKARVRIEHDQQRAALVLTVLGARRNALAGRRVTVRYQGRVIQRENTDAEGVLRMAPLEPGTYEVECQDLGAVEFMIPE